MLIQGARIAATLHSFKAPSVDIKLVHNSPPLIHSHAAKHRRQRKRQTEITCCGAYTPSHPFRAHSWNEPSEAAAVELALIFKERLYTAEQTAGTRKCPREKQRKASIYRPVCKESWLAQIGVHQRCSRHEIHTCLVGCLAATAEQVRQPLVVAVHRGGFIAAGTEHCSSVENDVQMHVCSIN